MKVKGLRKRRFGIQTDAKVFVPSKSLESYSVEDQKQTVEQFWPQCLRRIFVISIRPDRYQRLLVRTGCFKPFVTLFPGTDGRFLPSKNELQKQGIYESLPGYPTMTRGEIACFLSHRSLWQKAVDEKIEVITILEDDCLLQPHPERIKLVNEAVSSLEEGSWDVLFIGRNPAVAKNRKKVATRVTEVGFTWGMFAYAVTLDGARRLLEASEGPVTMGLDKFVSEVTRRRKFVAVEPIPFLYCTDEISDTMNIL